MSWPNASPFIRRFLIGCLAAAVGWAVPAAEPAAGQTHEARYAPHEQWYILKLQGEPAGWWVSRQTVDGDQVTTGMKMHMNVARAGTALSLAVAMRFTETADGEPIKAQLSQNFARFQQKQAITFDALANTATLLTLDEDNRIVTRKTMDLPERDWLPPAAASRHVAERLEAGDRRFDLWTLDPTAGVKPIRLRIQVLGEQTITVAGKTVPATKTRITTQLTPTTEVSAIEYLDDRGIPVRQTVNLANIELTLEAADRALALAEREPVELLNDTLIRPSRRIDDPRTVRRATFILRGREPGMTLPDLPESSVQQVTRLADDRFRITVDLDEPHMNPPAEDGAKDAKDATPDPPAVQRSSMIDGADPRIVALTKRALRETDAPDARRKATVLRQFVNRYIDEKSLGVGMASASEVARTAEGDCTEHAVLLAAMLRAADIPSRVASGLIYVNESGLGENHIFGYHAWTQAWIDGRWIDLDAVLGGPRDFDATHILLTTSPMADGQWSNDLVDLAPLIGRIDIEVQSLDAP